MRAYQYAFLLILLGNTSAMASSKYGGYSTDSGTPFSPPQDNHIRPSAPDNNALQGERDYIDEPGAAPQSREPGTSSTKPTKTNTFWTHVIEPIVVSIVAFITLFGDEVLHILAIIKTNVAEPLKENLYQLQYFPNTTRYNVHIKLKDFNKNDLLLNTMNTQNRGTLSELGKITLSQVWKDVLLSFPIQDEPTSCTAYRDNKWSEPGIYFSMSPGTQSPTLNEVDYEFMKLNPESEAPPRTDLYLEYEIPSLQTNVTICDKIKTVFSGK